MQPGQHNRLLMFLGCRRCKGADSLLVSWLSLFIEINVLFYLFISLECLCLAPQMWITRFNSTAWTITPVPRPLRLPRFVMLFSRSIAEVAALHPFACVACSLLLGIIGGATQVGEFILINIQHRCGRGGEAAQQGAHTASSLEPTISPLFFGFFYLIQAKGIFLWYTSISPHRCSACGHFSRTLDKPLATGNLLMGRFVYAIVVYFS